MVRDPYAEVALVKLITGVEVVLVVGVVNEPYAVTCAVMVVKSVVVLWHAATGVEIDPYASIDKVKRTVNVAVVTVPSVVKIVVSTFSCLLRLSRARRTASAEAVPYIVVVVYAVCVAYSVQRETLSPSCLGTMSTALALTLALEVTSLVPLCRTSSMSAIHAKIAHKIEIKNGGLVAKGVYCFLLGLRSFERSEGRQDFCT